MLIWIDGTFGIGKTTVANYLLKTNQFRNFEILDSDYYHNEMVEKICDDEKNEYNFLDAITIGCLPQKNIFFINYFRNLINEKINENPNLIILMALTFEESKKGLYDYFKDKEEDFIHIILDADEEEIIKRIKNDENRDQSFALEFLTPNQEFLHKRYENDIRIDTTNKPIEEVSRDVVNAINDYKAKKEEKNVFI